MSNWVLRDVIRKGVEEQMAITTPALIGQVCKEWFEIVLELFPDYVAPEVVVWSAIDFTQDHVFLRWYINTYVSKPISQSILAGMAGNAIYMESIPMLELAEEIGALSDRKEMIEAAYGFSSFATLEYFQQKGWELPKRIKLLL